MTQTAFFRLYTQYKSKIIVYKGMEEEFTTGMHAELLAGEMTLTELRLCEIYVDMIREKSLSKALSMTPYKYITADYFKAHIAGAMGCHTEYDIGVIMDEVSEYSDV